MSELKIHSPWVADLVAEAEISGIKQMAMRAAEVADVASLAWGLPSFSTPAYIRAGVAEQLESDPDIGKYALPGGLKPFCEQVALQHAQATGITVDADSQVMISAGNMQALSTLLHVVLNPGDEVILTDPGFASHYQQIRLQGGIAVPWCLDEANGWALDLEALPALISSKTKVLILVSPSNPTGTLFSEADLRRLGEIVLEHGILLVLDDPYSHFVYDNSECFSLASVEALGNQLAYCFSFSKAYAMSGWRLGYMILPPELKQQALKVHDANMICAPRIAQVAGMIALSQPAPHLDEFRTALVGRRELILQRLDGLPHLFDYIRPQGAYYVFPRILAKHTDAWSFCIDLLQQARVSLSPGSAFGPSGEHHVRMAYCVDEATINTAFDRIEHYLGGAR